MKIRYRIERCEFGDWKMGFCTKSCGGGKKIDVRNLLNSNTNISSCGPLSKINPCNVQSCNRPFCHNVQFISGLFLYNWTFVLQDWFINDRVVYHDAKNEFYLYSILIMGSGLDGSWAIAKFPGILISSAVWFNVNCKGNAYPGSGSCRHDWQFFGHGDWTIDRSAQLTCTSFA